MNNITVHLQIHKNQIAVDECLRRFRLNFPNLPMYVHGDNGNDFSYLTETYNNTEYKHWDISISPRGLSGGNWRGYLERVLLTCKRYPNEWILFLEEDINTLHNKIVFPTSDFAGIKGHELSKSLTDYIRTLHPTLVDIKYNMCGGSIAKMDAMVKSIEFILNGNIDMDYITKLDKRVTQYSDVLISTTLLLSGYTYSEWEQLSERASGVFKPNAVFDHSWKEFYNKTDWETFVNYKNKNMKNNLNKLFNWPSEKPTITPSSHHWFGEGNAEILKKLITEINPKYILEMGSWTGIGSTNFILNNALNAHLVCVDHWSSNIEDHIQSSFPREEVMKLYDEISNVWEIFLLNNWEHQNHLTPIRKKTNEGLDLLGKLDIPFDLIYIDAHHDYNGVLYDIETSGKYWPNAVMCGDDYLWPNGDVSRAVNEYADKNNLNVIVNDQCWCYTKKS